MATLAAKLLALYELHRRGLLTDDEFARAKAREIAAAGQVPVHPAGQAVPPGTPPAPPGAPSPPKTLNPVVPAVAISLGAAGAAGGLGG